MSDKLQKEIQKDWMELDKKYEAMGEKKRSFLLLTR